MMDERQTLMVNYSGYLTINARGGMKLTSKEPRLVPGERSIKLVLKVPDTIFKLPALSATIEIPSGANSPTIDAKTILAIEDALRLGTGISFSVSAGPTP